jgi:predicted aspartyl protease
MGDVYLELTIANIHDPSRQQNVSFLVDTGATRAWIPHQIADDLGIEPAGSVSLELADGSIKEFPYGFCLFDFGGETVAGNVVIGPSECEPIVGTHVLSVDHDLLPLDCQIQRKVADLAIHHERFVIY